MCLLSALAGIALAGMDINIFVQVGFVVLVGLAAKNAILIVEVARQLGAEGADTTQAAIEATRRRFRPIVMTSIAFILGVVPLAIASGAGAASRRAMGTAVIGGMLASTFIAILFVPVYYVLMVRLSEWMARRKKPAPVKVEHAAAPVKE